MRIIVLLAALLVMSNLSAQSKEKNHPITKETFKVKLKIEKNKRVSVLSFVDSKGRNRKAEGFYESGDVIPLFQSKPGTIITGTFQFDSFASAGGLGTTRVVKGEGKGYLKITNILIIDDDLDSISKLAGVGDMAFRLK